MEIEFTHFDLELSCYEKGVYIHNDLNRLKSLARGEQWDEGEILIPEECPLWVTAHLVHKSHKVMGCF